MECLTPDTMGDDHDRDVWKLRVRQVLLDACNVSSTFDGLVYRGGSHNVWTAKAFKKNSLKLVPYTLSLTIVADDDDHDGVTMPIDGNRVAVLRSRSVEPLENGAHFLVPFWQVGYTQDSAEANMSMTTVQVTTKLCEGREEHCVTKFKIPVMTNNCEIGSGVQLLQFKKSAEATKRAAARAEAKEPPKKSRKHIHRGRDAAPRRRRPSAA